MLELNPFVHVVILNIVFNAVEVSYDTPNFISIFEAGVEKFICPAICNNHILAAPEPLFKPLLV
jgi:hypothetical protein